MPVAQNHAKGKHTERGPSQGAADRDGLSDRLFTRSKGWVYLLCTYVSLTPVHEQNDTKRPTMISSATRQPVSYTASQI